MSGHKFPKNLGSDSFTRINENNHIDDNINDHIDFINVNNNRIFDSNEHALTHLDINDKGKVKTEAYHNNVKHESNIKIYLDKILGKGSYAKVFPGRYRNKTVAVKIMCIDHLERSIVKQLERELDVIRLLQKHNHPNIATYYKIFHTHEKIIIVMELCSGGELRKYIERGLDLTIVRNYFSQILKGCKHLLSLNIIHRDIKSANILLTGDKKTIKIIDFGLSKIFKVDLNDTMLGSPLYMSPELLAEQTYDSKSDIWSLGILLYEMVYGVTPFHHHKTTLNLKISVQSNNINYSLHSTKGIYEVPKNLIEYMKKLLELDPHRRMNWNDICDAEWLDENILHIDSIIAPNVQNNNNGKRPYPYQHSKHSRDIINKKNSLNRIQTQNRNTNLPTRVDTHDVFTLDIDDIDMNADSDVNVNNKNSPTVDDILDHSEEDNYKKNISPKTKTNNKCSEPIPILKNDKYNKYNKNNVSNGMSQPKVAYGRGRREGCVSYPLSYEQSPQLQGVHYLHGESVGDVFSLNENDININDLSIIANNPGDQYHNLIKKQKDKATGSGLIDIDDVDKMLIANVPERTTAYEYFRKGTSDLGSYLYAHSAPVASTIVQNLGNVAKTTIDVIGISTSGSPKS